LDKSDNFVIILGGKVMMNDRQMFFLLRGALSCLMNKRSENMNKLRSGKPWLRRYLRGAKK
jgi:hypothetical protein